MWQQSLTCSLSWCISAVAAFSLPASLSSSSWFSANHCSFFFRAATSSLCLSSNTRLSKVLSPDTFSKTKHHFCIYSIKVLYKLGAASKLLTDVNPRALYAVLPETDMTWDLARSLSFFISCRSTSRACFSCFSLQMSSDSVASLLCTQKQISMVSEGAEKEVKSNSTSVDWGT